MQKTILTFSVSNLSNENLFHFATVVDDQFGRAAIAQIDAVYQNFHAALLDFQLKLEPVHYVSHTKNIAQKDRERTSVYSTLHMAVRVAMRSPVAAEADAAAMLKSVFDKHKGLQYQDYRQKSGSLFNFIEELETNHQQRLNTLHLSEWLNILKTHNTDFDALYEHRNVQERNYVSHKEVKAARNLLLQRYRELVASFEAALLMGILSTDPQTVAQPINEYIEREIITLNIAKGKRKAKKEKQSAQPPTEEGENDF